MNAPFTTTRRVEFRDTDAAGIMHFSMFFVYMEQAEHQWLRSRGLSVIMHDDDGTISWPRVAASCDYHSAVRFEDVLDITVSIGRLGSKSVTYEFEFTHESRRVAVGEMTSVCCRIVQGQSPQSIAIPATILQKLTGEQQSLI